jgi:hypothetical protein
MRMYWLHNPHNRQAYLMRTKFYIASEATFHLRERGSPAAIIIVPT